MASAWSDVIPDVMGSGQQLVPAIILKRAYSIQMLSKVKGAKAVIKHQLRLMMGDPKGLPVKLT